MVSEAVLPTTGAVPSNVVPSRKLTVPVAPVGTVAVKIIGLPEGAGLSDGTVMTGGVGPTPGVAGMTSRLPLTNVKV